MRIRFRCGCGGINYNRKDWLCHFKYRGFWNGLKNLIKTHPIIQF